jgi:hypothetical protein
MKPQQFTISPEGEELYKIPKPGDLQCLRCFYLQRLSQSGSSIDGISWRWNRGKIFTVRFTVKKFRLGARDQNYDVARTLILQRLARVGDGS